MFSGVLAFCCKTAMALVVKLNKGLKHWNVMLILRLHLTINAGSLLRSSTLKESFSFVFRDLIDFLQKILFSFNNVNKLNLNKRQPNLFYTFVPCFTFDGLLCLKFVLFGINLAEIFWKSINLVLSTSFY